MSQGKMIQWLKKGFFHKQPVFSRWYLIPLLLYHLYFTGKLVFINRIGKLIFAVWIADLYIKVDHNMMEELDVFL